MFRVGRPLPWLPSGRRAEELVPDGVTVVRDVWAVTGPTLTWVRHLDRAIVEEARRWGAVEYELCPAYGASSALVGYDALATLRGRTLHGPQLVTARGCSLPKASGPGRRSRAPQLVRDVVIAGTPVECNLFGTLAAGAVAQLAEWFDLPLTWTGRDDRRDAIVGFNAVCTLHRHGQTATRQLGIDRGQRPAASASLAVLPDQWLMAMTRRFGPDAAEWPDPLAAAHVLTALRRG